VEEITLKALEQNPDHRYQTADEMLQELEKVLRSFKVAPGQGDLAAYLKHLADAPDEPEQPDPALSSYRSTASLESSRAAEGEGTGSGVATAAGEAPTLGGTPVASPASGPAREPTRTGTSVSQVGPVDTPPLAPVGAGRVEVEEGGGRGRWILIAIITLLVLAATASYVFRAEIGGLFGGAATSEEEVAPDEPAPGDEGEPAGEEGPEDSASLGAASEGTGEETQEAPVPDIEEMVDQALAEREKELRRQLESERRKLQRELDEARAKENEPADSGSSAPPSSGATPS
jgi:hypothetical protein